MTPGRRSDRKTVAEQKKKRQERKKRGRDEERQTDGGGERGERETERAEYSHVESDAPNQLRCCQSSSP